MTVAHHCHHQQILHDVPDGFLHRSLRGAYVHLQREHLQIVLPLVLRDGRVEGGHHGRGEAPRLRDGPGRGEDGHQERPGQHQQGYVEEHQVGQLQPRVGLAAAPARRLQHPYEDVVAPPEHADYGCNRAPLDGARDQQEETVGGGRGSGSAVLVHHAGRVHPCRRARKKSGREGGRRPLSPPACPPRGRH